MSMARGDSSMIIIMHIVDVGIHVIRVIYTCIRLTCVWLKHVDRMKRVLFLDKNRHSGI